MSKELFMACHDALIEEYLEENSLSYDHWHEAYEATADRAYDRMRDFLDDRADLERKRRKEGAA